MNEERSIVPVTERRLEDEFGTDSIGCRRCARVRELALDLFEKSEGVGEAIGRELLAIVGDDLDAFIEESCS